jgi:hypothetical protein
LSNLDLSVFENGTLIAQSISTVDDAQMLDLSNVSAGDYSIQVSYSFLGGSSEQYALAWSSEEIPEPATFSLLICAGLLALRRPRSISPR